MTTMVTCACPGCDQPGNNQCSACKSKFYCGPTCQTADWSNHKEECPGHLRKVGMTHLEKAKGFDRAKNWPQAVHHTDLAATKLKRLKDHPIEDVDAALRIKYNALSLMGRHKEGLERAKELYCLYHTKHTHPPAIYASFAVIQSCGLNKEYYNACLYARTLWETITLCRDSHIPDNLRDDFTARGAFELARALWKLAENGDMPAEEQKETGVEAIMLARRSLEMNTRLFGAESREVAGNMDALASILEYFNDVDDDEVLRLSEQMIAINTRLHGTLSISVATGEFNLGMTYKRRARRAKAAHDLNRCIANFELVVPHYREAARIYRAINQVENANKSEEQLAHAEEWLRNALEFRESGLRNK